MRTSNRSRLGLFSFSTSFLTVALVLVFLFLTASQPANALPAFARKYGLRCSACHESWPMLNYFGQKFKDNGYQIMNDRDAPIWQNPGYWPVTFRITPIWHRVSTGKVDIDQYAGGAPTGTAVQGRLETSGFDLSGLDFHTGGTLEKNISFYVLPSSDPTAAFHFETVMGRFDNIFHTPWLNIKLGRFELDNLLSEKRILTLTANGGIYQLYHFRPIGDNNLMGAIGDNQLGAELMGHSWDDRTRYAIALVSSSDGNVNLVTTSNAYSAYLTASQAFDAGRLGVQRLGGYLFIGQDSTYYRTSGATATTPGALLNGSGIGNKSYNREGFVGQFYFGSHIDLQVVTQHGWDNAWLGQGYGNALNPSNGSAGSTTNPNNFPGTVLPVGAQAPTWNGVLFEPHYVYSPQLIFIGRYETIRMSRQANGAGCTTSLACFGSNGTYTNPQSASNLGNTSTFTIGYRYNPFMTNRAGFAWHNEYNWLHVDGAAPDGTAQNTSELLIGFDFDF